MDPAILTTINFIIDILGKVLPFFAPLILGYFALYFWEHYKMHEFVANIKWVTLQIKIPKDVFKSPQAMEFIFINAMYQTAPGTWYAHYVEGKVRQWFSLELVSIEGEVYFFIHTPEFYKNLIESQLYAQYPKAEIAEVPDYTEDVAARIETEDWNMWGCEFKLTKADGYPIKTYIDYGLDKDVGKEEEQKIDPITPMLEYLGALGPGEQAWYQIMIRASMKKYHTHGTWFGKHGWVDEAKEEIKKISEKYATKNDKGEKVLDYVKIPKSAQNEIEAISRAVDKQGFDVGIRAMYIAKKDNYKGINVVGLTSMIKQYNSGNLNGFGVTHFTGFDYPWQDFNGSRAAILKKEMMDAYRLRSYFYPPHGHKRAGFKFLHRKPFILNSEELATIFHFPGQVSETPTFKRIESKKSEPPANLPF